MNVPRTIAAVVSSRLATYEALGTTLGAEDMYNLLEVIVVDSYNQQQAAKVKD